jgi:hypothetical protein
MSEIIPDNPGIYYNITFAQYQAIDAVNNSILKILSDERQSPAHAFHYIKNGRPDTPALKIGRAIDAHILEPLRFFELYAVCPECDKRTKEGKATYQEFEMSRQPEQELISQRDYEKIIQIYNSVINSQAMRLIEGGKSQVVAVWQDKTTGLLCKARYDYYQKDIPMITDLKSTQDSSPDGFGYDVFKYSYFQQAGFYCMGHEVLTGCEPCFAIFAIEKEEPFVHTSFELGMKTIEAGKNAARKALVKYKQCKDSGVWPMFSDKVLMLDIPVWALEKNGINKYQI